MPRTHTRRRCALVAAVLAAAAAAPDELRAAVVFAGHPRTFLTTPTIRQNVIAGVDALCTTIKCEVYAVVAKTDGSLFPNPAPHAEACAEDVVDAFRNLQHAAVGQIVSAEDPHPEWRRDDCEEEDRRPDLNYGRELAHARAAWALVREAEDGFLYDVVTRLRFDVVWVRPPPSLLEVLVPASNDIVSDLNVAVVPRHHFPINNHVAILGRKAANAYFDGPIQVWRNCSEDWSRTPASLSNLSLIHI